MSVGSGVSRSRGGGCEGEGDGVSITRTEEVYFGVREAKACDRCVWRGDECRYIAGGKNRTCTGCRAAKVCCYLKKRKRGGMRRW
jgi:hypothetical protein